MARMYAISIGYLDGIYFKEGVEAAWNILKEKALLIAEYPGIICVEAEKHMEMKMITNQDGENEAIFVVGDEDEGGTLMEYCEAYKNDRGTMIFNDADHTLYMSCSGDDGLKGITRRAMARLLISEMHSRNIDVNFTVS